jgi:hypothetical protein
MFSHRDRRGTERIMFTAETQRTRRSSIFSLAGSPPEADKPAAREKPATLRARFGFAKVGKGK